MQSWRRVEVAACEAMNGPVEDELDAIRPATRELLEQRTELDRDRDRDEIFDLGHYTRHARQIVGRLADG